MDLDVVQLQSQIDMEQFTDALKQGVMGFAQTILPMAQQGGQDPMDALQKIASIMKEREKGTPVHEAVLKVFKPKEQPAGAAPANPLEAMLGGQAQAGPPGAQAQQGGGGQQGMDMQTLLAGLTGKGDATMAASTKRRTAI
jgi:hypothetical protein